jgi:hypothetical protein
MIRGYIKYLQIKLSPLTRRGLEKLVDSLGQMGIIVRPGCLIIIEDVQVCRDILPGDIIIF